MAPVSTKLPYSGLGVFAKPKPHGDGDDDTKHLPAEQDRSGFADADKIQYPPPEDLHGGAGGAGGGGGGATMGGLYGRGDRQARCARDPTPRSS